MRRGGSADLASAEPDPDTSVSVGFSTRLSAMSSDGTTLSALKKGLTPEGRPLAMVRQFRALEHPSRFRRSSTLDIPRRAKTEIVNLRRPSHATQGPTQSTQSRESSLEIKSQTSGSSHEIPVRKRDEPIKHLIVSMEKSICKRLDRIESALKQERMSSLHGDDVSLSLDELSKSHGVVVEASRVDSDETNDEEAEQQGLDTDTSPTPGSPIILRKEWHDSNLRHKISVEYQDSERNGLQPLLIRQRHQDFDQDVVKPWYILLPSSPFRLAWDCITALFIAYDMAVVPIQLAFEKAQSQSQASNPLFWVFLVFWTLDLPLNFFTAYYRQGTLEVNHKFIARNYCFTWLLVDVFLVLSTWSEVWIASESGYLLGRLGKTVRVSRIVRGFRILRVAKLKSLSATIEDTITSDYHKIVMKMVRLVLTIIWLNHFVACAWWALGESTTHSRLGSWTEYFGFRGDELPVQYFTALHWSLTQFTPASIEISARNLEERVFSVIVLLFAMVTFSSFVSSITAAVTELRQLTDDDNFRQSLLRRYLRSRQVPIELSSRVLHFVDYRLSKQKEEVQENDVELLSLLSKPLQLELAQHIFSPTLKNHPFFQCYAEADSVPMRRLCLEAVSQTLLSMEDLLFTEGSPCEQMFFIRSGQLRYLSTSQFAAVSQATSGLRQEAGTPASFAAANSFTQAPSFAAGYTPACWNSATILEEREWCCEVVLWCPWVHCGSMVSEGFGEVIAVDAMAFTGITAAFHNVNRLSSRYAVQFMEKTRRVLREGCAITDVTTFPIDMVEEMLWKSRRRRTVDPGGSFTQMAREEMRHVLRTISSTSSPPDSIVGKDSTAGPKEDGRELRFAEISEEAEKSIPVQEMRSLPTIEEPRIVHSF